MISSAPARPAILNSALISCVKVSYSDSHDVDPFNRHGRRVNNARGDKQFNTRAPVNPHSVISSDLPGVGFFLYTKPLAVSHGLGASVL